ncbi:MAG: nicotinate-nucleotide adenylyltransferase [Myxococcota bacterium]|jgi:nicotinate-nucleotide adenylyltransferase
MNTIVFGGSFDPLHDGHLAVADAVQKNFKVDEFLWLPSWHAVHKLDVRPADAEFRARCIEQVLIGRNPTESLCRIEIDARRSCFSVDTLSKLAADKPRRQLYFLLGGDSLSHLNTWHDLPRLFSSCEFLLMPRPQWGHAQLEDYRNQLPQPLKETFRAQFIDMPVVDLSSSSIRKQLAAKNMPQGLPPQVQQLILDEKVYGVC